MNNSYNRECPIAYINFFFCFGGGKKFSTVKTLFPVLFFNANLASISIFPPFFPATAFSFMPFGSSVSAICHVESSAKGIKINPASDL
jgi:hypothetical protein